MRDGGSIAPQFLFVLLFIAILAIGVARFLSAAALAERNSRLRFFADKELTDAALGILAALKKDPTPEADGRFDPVQELDGRVVGGIELGITDRSSAINVNFVRKNVFEKTALSSLLTPGRSADELQQYREDAGLSILSAHYGAFFQPDDFTGRLTTYGWANVNLTDEFALSSFASSITGSEEQGEALRLKLRPLLLAKTLVTRDSLRTFLGAQYDAYFPLISAEPVMNVNFVDVFVLRELCKYPDYGLESPAAKAERIIRERETHEIDEKDLKSLLGVDEENRLLHYFGSRTWFWELSAEKNGRRCVMIIGRYPDGDGESSSAPRLEIVETRFE